MTKDSSPVTRQDTFRIDPTERPCWKQYYYICVRTDGNKVQEILTHSYESLIHAEGVAISVLKAALSESPVFPNLCHHPSVYLATGSSAC